MKLKIILVWMTISLGIQAQSQELKTILHAVETNHPELRQFRQQNAVQEQADRTWNNLDNPAVEYIYQWGTPGVIGNASELNVTQGFDFPTLYAQRNKLMRERRSLYDYQYQELRREILLQAEKLYYDWVLVQKKLALVIHEKQQMDLLQFDFQASVQEGLLTGFQGKKLKMEKMNLQVSEVTLRADLDKIMQEFALLNGGEAIPLSDLSATPLREIVSLEQISAEMLARDPLLNTRRQEQQVADQELAVTRHQNLPSLELGYKRTTGFQEEFNGVIMGLSVPLFQNRGKVKQARLQQQLARLNYDRGQVRVTNELQTSYQEAVRLKALWEEYGEVTLEEDWCDDLKRAFDAHEITTIEYFAELAAVHGAYVTRLELENRYYKALADLYRGVFDF